MATKIRRGKPAIVRVCAPDEEAKLAALKLLIARAPATPGPAATDERRQTADR